jgi:hypothetical protein
MLNLVSGHILYIIHMLLVCEVHEYIYIYICNIYIYICMYVIYILYICMYIIYIYIYNIHTFITYFNIYVILSYNVDNWILILFYIQVFG